MTTITISKNLIKEKDLILVSRRQYLELLKKTRSFDEDKEWQKISKKNFLRFYNQGDAIYDYV